MSRSHSQAEATTEVPVCVFIFKLLPVGVWMKYAPLTFL